MTRIRLKADKADGQVSHVVAQEDQGTMYLSLEQTASLLGVHPRLAHLPDGSMHVDMIRKEKSAPADHISGAVRARLEEVIEHNRDRLAEINEEIFHKPEPGNEEFHAAEIIMDYLSSLGFSVDKELTGIHPQTQEQVLLATGFQAVKKGSGSGPVITIMLEYDALPMGHACGHNLIAVSGLAAACALLPWMDEWTGELRIIGTPAEEGGQYGGKIPLLAAGHFTGSEIVLITHPGDRWDTGADFLAISGGRFTFTGVPSHASAAPEKGVSALDAAILAYTGIETLREHLRDDARIHGIIKEGGTASNIVPERASLSYAVRALDQPYVEELKDKIEKCVRAGADAAGAESHIHWSFGYSAPINVPLLDDLVLNMAVQEQIPGIKKWEALGSSDLGNVGFEIPTCNLWFQIAPEGVLPHTHEFLEAAGTPEGFTAAIQAGLVLAMAASVLFNRPDIVEAIGVDFRRRKADLLLEAE